jgi:hypothetical protein
MGPTYKIAELLKLSPLAATSYCEKVRSLSGLGSRLHYKTIAQYVAQHINEAQSPQIIVRLIQKNELSSLPSAAVKPKRNEKKISQLHVRGYGKGKTPKRGKSKKTKRYEFAKPVPPPSYLVRTSYFDQKRVSEDRLEHCPHGVPHGRVCAICEPKKFREMTGID